MADIPEKAKRLAGEVAQEFSAEAARLTKEALLPIDDFIRDSFVGKIPKDKEAAKRFIKALLDATGGTDTLLPDVPTTEELMASMHGNRENKRK